MSSWEMVILYPFPTPGPCKDGLYPLSFHSNSVVPQALITVHSSIWHNRLGHPSTSVLSRLGSCLGSKVTFNSFCKTCALSKSHKLPFISTNKFSSSLFEIIHSDVWMSPVTSVSGFRYYVLFTDECSRYTWLYPMRRKNEVLSHFKTLVAMIKNIFNGSVKYLQSDNGTEYVNHNFSDYCASLGILQRFSCPYTPQQNGLAERKHRHIASMTRTLLLTSNVPTNLWAEAVSTSVYLINILPTPTLSWETPHKILYGHSPSYSSLCVFGCACFPHIESTPSNKLSTQSVECVFIGYSPNHKGYRCFNPKSGKVIISRHVLFDEATFPYKHLQVSSESSYVEFELRLMSNTTPPAESHATHSSPSQMGPSPSDNNVTEAAHSVIAAAAAPDVMISSTPPLDQQVAVTTITNSAAVGTTQPPPVIQYQRRAHASIPSIEGCSTVATTSTLNQNSDPSPTPNQASATTSEPTATHEARVRTRLQDGIIQRRIRTDGTVLYPIPKALLSVVNSLEPTCYSQASKDPLWRSAMAEEINALLKNQTWSLVPPSPVQHVVGCKWIFRIKRKSDGSVERYKARLVAKGFHQQYGIEYGETYSPVVKPATIRTVLCLAVSRNWPLRQLDVKNAFLHGFLQEDVYMSQPPGFIDPSRPTHVCKLLKSIYGLKQAPRIWFERMSHFLLAVGFRLSKADSSLFIYRHGGHTIFFLLYVDDIVVTADSEDLLLRFINMLSNGFDIKDLGPLHYFLGLQVISQADGLHINQLKYAHDILAKYDLLQSQPVSTPMTTKSPLNSTDGTLLDNPTIFREMIGSLQYLTITRPDIAYSVNFISQFMSQPRTPHLVAAKRILRYVKGTIDYGLYFTPQRHPVTIAAYSDADWAGCLESRRSQSGYLIYIGTNLVSWCSKKQPTIARSSAESEYRALAHASAETTWLASLLYELGANIQYPILLYCDNLSATYMASNPVFHARTKHIELDYHFVREKVAVGSHLVRFIPSTDQPADLLTKALHRHRHKTLCSKLARPRLSSLTGGVKQLDSLPQSRPNQETD